MRVQCNKEAGQTSDYCVAKNATLGMTIRLGHES
jgi:hypothetical protein